MAFIVCIYIFTDSVLATAEIGSRLGDDMEDIVGKTKNQHLPWSLVVNRNVASFH